MDELLKKMLESDVLSEETKAQLKEQFSTFVEDYLAEQRESLEAEVRASLTAEFVNATEELVEDINIKIDEYLEREMSELKESVEKFRDLEVEYAEKLIEEKQIFADQFAEEMDGLVNKLDAFLEVRLSEELSELNESIEEVKRIDCGRRIFEAVKDEVAKFSRGDLSSTERELEETKDKLYDTQRALAKIEQDRLDETRTTKIENLLSPLGGSSREQMKLLLSNVPTEKLDEGYKTYIGRILKENFSAETEQNKNNKQLTEDKKQQTKLVTGNEKLNEDVNVSKVKNEQLSRMKKLAGIKS